MARQPSLAIVLGAMVLAPAAASAAPRASTRLAYVRDVSAAACPDESALRQEIAQRIGYDPFAPAALERVSATITSSAGTFRGVVQYEDEAGQVRGARELDANDCAELVSSLALTVVILLDPPGAHVAPEPGPILTPFDPPRMPAPEPPPSRPSKPPAARARLRAGAGTLGSIGVAPAPSVGLYAFLGLQLERWGVDAEGRLDLPSSSDGARTSLVLGTLAPCRVQGPLHFCLTASFGALNGEGLGAGEPRSARTFYSTVGPRVGLELPITPAWRIHARVDATIPLTPTTLRQGGAELWTTPIVGAALGIGVTGHFL
jgi:hypothetical protein